MPAWRYTLPALLLLVVGGALWTMGHFERRTLAARRDLLMMRFDAPIAADDAIARASRLVPAAVTGWRADLRRARTQAQYWRQDYESLTGANEESAQDASALLLRANAAYRQIPAGLAGSAAAERLDAVAAMYLDALERDPQLMDAAYNYELVVRARAALGGGAAGRARAARAASRPGTQAATLHGVPGAKPASPDTGEFKIIVPQRPEERSAQPEAGLSGAKARKG